MASCSIHPRAVVQGGATIGARSRIGPFCMIGPEVVLGEGCILESQVMVTGRTTVGPRTRIFPFASLGPEPQNVKYAGEPSTLTIGSDCIIREGVTMHPGTANGRMTTIVGDRCVCLAHSHVAHDCVVGNDVVLSSHVMLAGHCTIQDCVTIGEGAGIHQFVRIGRHACVGVMSAVENDVIPYGLAVGNRAHLAGLNMAGLHRCGFTPEQIHGLRRAYRLLFADEGTLSERMEDVAAEFTSDPFVQDMLEFIRSGQDRGICTPRDLA
jgi:UDP-N-acetylglucosamine acyltransferase